MAKLPSFPFYPTDWLGDTNLKRCSHAAKGVWMDLLCLMHQCDQRGVLATNGKAWTDDDAARAAGGDQVLALAAIQELLDKGVASRNKSGALFSRRMVRDEDRKRKNQENGSKGGNPSLRGGGPDIPGVNRSVEVGLRGPVDPRSRRNTAGGVGNGAPNEESMTSGFRITELPTDGLSEGVNPEPTQKGLSPSPSPSSLRDTPPTPPPGGSGEGDRPRGSRGRDRALVGANPPRERHWTSPSAPGWVREVGRRLAKAEAVPDEDSEAFHRWCQGEDVRPGEMKEAS